MKIKQIRPEYVEFIPDCLDEGVLYISRRYRTAVHKCCCGCGREVVTPLSPAEWSVELDGSRVSLWPSIGNWSYPCRSHYVIQDGRVLKARPLTECQIQRVKAEDRADIRAQICIVNSAKEEAALAQKRNTKIAQAHSRQSGPSWLQHLIRWWKSIG